MSSVTWFLRRYNKDDGRVGLSGTTVYVQHPDDPSQILEMPHPDVEAARATFKTVVAKFFSSRSGWKVTEKREDDEPIDVASWRPPPPPPPPTPEELAAQMKALRTREMGWAIEGETMVLSLKRQRRDSDLEIALVDNGSAVTALHVLVSVDDSDGIGREGLFKWLARADAPKLEVLTLESPWESRKELGARQMTGLTEFLEARPLRELAAIGSFALPSSKALRSTERVRIHNPRLRPADLERIGEAPNLRVLHLTAGELDARMHTALSRLPLARLEELALEWTGDAGAALDAILDGGGGNAPRVVHVQGDGRPLPTLRAAVERWQRTVPESTLTLGDWPMQQLDDETRAVVEGAGIVLRASLFSEESRDADLRRMWAPLR